MNEGEGTAQVSVLLLTDIERIVVFNYTTEGTRGGATGIVTISVYNVVIDILS